MYNCCLKGIQQAKGIPRLFAASECPQEKAFPRKEHCRVFPVQRFFSYRKIPMIRIFDLILDFSKETLS